MVVQDLELTGFYELHLVCHLSFSNQEIINRDWPLLTLNFRVLACKVF